LPVLAFDDVDPGGLAEAAVLAILKVQHLANRQGQARQMSPGDIPNDRRLNTVIFVAKNVSNPGNLRPGHVGMR
jgi:hypothetical protein